VVGNVINKRIREFIYRDAPDDILLERKRDIAFHPKYAENHRKRKVRGIEITTGAIVEFDSIAKARSAGFGSHISSCCNGRRQSSAGYKWSYIE
jgi:hypothetical protein